MKFSNMHVKILPRLASTSRIRTYPNTSQKKKLPKLLLLELLEASWDFSWDLALYLLSKYFMFFALNCWLISFLATNPDSLK